MSDVTMRHLSDQVQALADQLAAERQARLDREKRGISITRLHVPAMLWLLSIPTVLAAGIGTAAFYHETKAHAADVTIHLNRDRSIREDGPAYQSQIKDLEKRIDGVAPRK